MFESLFDIPLYIMGPLLIGALCLFTILGLVFVRRYVLPRLRIDHHDSHFSGAIVHSVMVFYGLAVALIAVNVFETYSDVSKIVSGEATQLAALYRDVSGYPEPIRGQLQKELREYTDQIVNGAWPLQHRGQIPTAGVEHMNRLQAILIGFEPTTEGQKALHAETLRAYNTTIQARRMRLDAVGTGLPAVMWVVILAGAGICMTACFFFRVDDAWVHGVLLTLLAMFVGLVIFMVLALDRPFRGDLGIGSEPYQLIYDQLMKQ
jgi:hypothetical protein